ncbi:hypothetical protein [Streptomyces adelaidensis]|uniref:hypothetical protein n=1 Tax=Streptomyces adelaidensis TaxID=2796465 RepID=UPI001F2482AB|nr:hypothetical protein [Streptomyces adelaidensis]
MSEDAAGAPKAGEAPKDEEKNQEDQAPEQRQKAWQARQDLVKHTARALASTLIDGDQFGQTGGTHYGDTIFHFGGRAEPLRRASGPIPRPDVVALKAVFREGPRFGEALARLRDERIVILTGGHATGRRSAALMLLSELGVDQLRDLDSHTTPTALRDELDHPDGYVLCDWDTGRHRPLRAPFLSGLREQLERVRGRLVITVESSAVPADVPSVRWEAPSTEDMLASHVVRALDEETWTKLSGLPYVTEFLVRQQPPEETKKTGAPATTTAAGGPPSAPTASWAPPTTRSPCAPCSTPSAGPSRTNTRTRRSGRRTGRRRTSSLRMPWNCSSSRRRARSSAPWPSASNPEVRPTTGRYAPTPCARSSRRATSTRRTATARSSSTGTPAPWRSTRSRTSGA